MQLVATAPSKDEARGRLLLRQAYASERQLTKVCASHRPLSAAWVEATDRLRDLYRELLLEHHALARRKAVGRSLWLLVYHQRIEVLRSQIKKERATPLSLSRQRGFTSPGHLPVLQLVLFGLVTDILV
eukprot:5000159-Pleurochrysis_carterae.AAC.2